MAADAISLLRMLAEGDHQLDDDQQKTIADALVALLEDGLNGNRAVAGTIADVVAAAVRAYPLQLSPSAERAAAVAKAASPGGNLPAIWALQAAADGALGPFLAALCAQPQIATAWLRGTPLRDAAVVAELQEIAGQLKGRFLSPFDRLQAEGLVASPSGRRASASGEQAAPASIETEEDALRPSRSSRRLRGQRSGGPGSISGGPAQQRQEGGGEGSGGGRALKRSGSSGGGSGSGRGGGLLLSRRARERARAAAGGSGRRAFAEGREAQPPAPRVTVQLLVATGDATADTDHHQQPHVRVAISIEDPAPAAAAAAPPPPRVRKRDRFAAAANAAAASAAAAVGDALALPGNLARAALSAVSGSGGGGGHEHGAAAAAVAAVSAEEGGNGHQEAPAGPLEEGAGSGGGLQSSATAAAGGPTGPLDVLRGIKRTAVARGQHIGEAVGGALAQQLAAVQQGRGGLSGKARSGGGAEGDGGRTAGGAEGDGGADATAGEKELRMSAPALAARAAAAARQVAAEAAAAARSRDGGAECVASQEVGEPAGVDDGCVAVGPLLGALAEVLAHGLRAAPAGRWGGRRGGGATPFSMLLALDARGGRRGSATQTGARGVARARAARRAGADDGARLDQWLRASLNARALGARLSSLCAQPAALAAWYDPGALVLQAAAAMSSAGAGNGGGQLPSGEQAEQQQQQQQQEEEQDGSRNGDGGQAPSKAGDLEVWELLRAVQALDALRFSLAPVAPPPAADPSGGADGPPAGRGASWLAGLRWRGASSSSAGGGPPPAPLRPIRPRRGPCSGRSQGDAGGEGHSSDSELSPLAAEEAVSPAWWTGGGLASFQALMRSGSSGRDRGGGGGGGAGPAGGA